MLKTLLRTYWRSMIHSLFFRDSRKAPGRLKKAGILLLLLYVAGIFLFLSGSMFFSMARPLNRLGLDWLYFLLALAAAFFLMLTGSVFLAITQLYEARDNELLLSLPIPASLILFSRLLLLYLTDLLYGIVAVGPALAAYALRIQVSPSWLIPSLLLYLLLPLPVISVSCLLGAAFAAVGKRIRHKTAAVLLLWLLFLGGYLFLCRRLFAGLPDLLLHAPRIAGWLARMLNPLYQIGSAAAGNLRALGYTALAFGLTFAAAYGILTVTFVKMITSNRGFRKIKYREKTQEAVSGPSGPYGKGMEAFLFLPRIYAQRRVRHCLLRPRQEFFSSSGRTRWRVLPGFPWAACLWKRRWPAFCLRASASWRPLTLSRRPAFPWRGNASGF